MLVLQAVCSAAAADASGWDGTICLAMQQFVCLLVTLFGCLLGWVLCFVFSSFAWFILACFFCLVFLYQLSSSSSS